MQNFLLLFLITIFATSCVAHSTLNPQEREALIKEKGASAAEKFLETNMAMLGFRSNVKIDVDQTVHSHSDDSSKKNKNSKNNNKTKKKKGKDTKSERSEAADGQPVLQTQDRSESKPEISLQPRDIGVEESVKVDIQEEWV